MDLQMKPLKIVMIDDDPAWVEILEHKLEQLHISHEMTVFEEGQKAIDYLHEKVLRTPEEIPELIILDIYLPGARGLEVLKLLKMDPDLKNIPVLIMSVSDKPTDILNSYKSGGAAFISKLDQPAILGKAIRQMRIFGMFSNTLHAPRPTYHGETNSI